MKKLFLFLLLFGFVTLKISDKSIASSAIQKIIIEHFVKLSERFNILTGANSSFKIIDISNDILKKSELPCEILQVNNEKIVLKESAILLFDDMDTYREFHDLPNNDVISRTLNFLVYIEKFEEQDLRFALHNTFLSETFLVKKNDESLSLITYAQFQQPKCRDWVQKEINQYNVQSAKWRSDRFFVEKYNNFNNCELIVHVANVRPTSYVEKDKKTNKTQVKGIGIEFNDIIGKSLNYSNYYKFFFIGTKKQSNETLKDDVQLFAMSSRLMNFYNENKTALVQTQPFRSIDEVILIPNDELYTPFEKIFLPFEIEVWIWMIATMTTAVVVILIIKCTPKVTQRFVFGLKVKSPMLNLITVAFGGGVKTLPGRNFSRFLLMSFIMFSLVMRTGYQAKQFEFLQKDMKKANVRTIEEMSLMKYSLAVSERNVYYEQMDFYKNFKIEKIERSEISLSFMRQLLSDGTKRGFIMTTDNLNTLNKYKNTEMNLNILPKIIMTSNIGFVFAKGHFVFESFNRKLIQLLESGIGRRITESNVARPTSIKEAGGPAILTLDHLSIGFELWLFFLAASAVAFLIELILKYFTSNKKINKPAEPEVDRWILTRHLFDILRQPVDSIKSRNVRKVEESNEHNFHRRHVMIDEVKEVNSTLNDVREAEEESGDADEQHQKLMLHELVSDPVGKGILNRCHDNFNDGELRVETESPGAGAMLNDSPHIVKGRQHAKDMLDALLRANQIIAEISDGTDEKEEEDEKEEDDDEPACEPKQIILSSRY